jgi:hypothetical protein
VNALPNFFFKREGPIYGPSVLNAEHGGSLWKSPTHNPIKCTQMLREMGWAPLTAQRKLISEVISLAFPFKSSFYNKNGIINFCMMIFRIFSPETMRVYYHYYVHLFLQMMNVSLDSFYPYKNGLKRLILTNWILVTLILILP